MSAAISVILIVTVVVAGIVLLIMGLWYLAWIPIPVGLLVGFLINVVFRGRDDTASAGDVGGGLSDDYKGGRWSKEA